MNDEIWEKAELIEKGDIISRKDLVEKGINNKLQHQQSLQHNAQDLDQTQEVDVKPCQVNVQNIDLTINNKIENYCGRIVGSVYSELNGELLPSADILLYFGAGTEYPVCKTSSDQHGNYTLEDLPPGFYTIKAKREDLSCLIRNVKVLPGETCNQPLSLSLKLWK